MATVGHDELQELGHCLIIHCAVVGGDEMDQAA